MITAAARFRRVENSARFHTVALIQQVGMGWTLAIL
jgi:hypothetical protein